MSSTTITTPYHLVCSMRMSRWTFRAVSEEEKAFALGLQVVLLRLLAYIPAPILFGSVIDTTCMVWKHNQCGDDGTICLLYDIDAFRLRYGSIALVLKVRERIQGPHVEMKLVAVLCHRRTIKLRLISSLHGEPDM